MRRNPPRAGCLTVTDQGIFGILLTRTLNAPRSLVWRAWTEPELVKRWRDVRPPGWTYPICEIDLQADGHCHYVQCNEDLSFQSGVSGTYLDVPRPPAFTAPSGQISSNRLAQHTSL